MVKECRPNNFDRFRETIVRKALRRPERLRTDPEFRAAAEDAALSAYAEVLERTNVLVADIPSKIEEARGGLRNPRILTGFAQSYYSSVTNLRQMGQERGFRPTLRLPEQMREDDFLNLDMESAIEIVKS